MSGKKRPVAKTFERQAPPMPRLADQPAEPNPDAEGEAAGDAQRANPRSDRDLIMRLVELVKAL